MESLVFELEFTIREIVWMKIWIQTFLCDITKIHSVQIVCFWDCEMFIRWCLVKSSSLPFYHISLKHRHSGLTFAEHRCLNIPEDRLDLFNRHFRPERETEFESQCPPMCVVSCHSGHITPASPICVLILLHQDFAPDSHCSQMDSFLQLQHHEKAEFWSGWRIKFNFVRPNEGCELVC
jgi:hypothetical protein